MQTELSDTTCQRLEAGFFLCLRGKEIEGKDAQVDRDLRGMA